MSTAAAPECHRCHAGLAASDLRCSACGTPRPGIELPPALPATTPTTANEKPANRSVIDNPYAVLAAVFLAMAVLGIPLIWMCRAWSPTTKLLLTIVTLIYTALIFWGFWLVMAWSWNNIRQSLS